MISAIGILLAATVYFPGVSLASSPEQISVEQAVEACGAERGFRIVGAVACLRADITPEVASAIEAHEGALAAIVLDTTGGDGASAFAIGRRLNRDYSKRIIAGECSSSCANYLVPVAHGRNLYALEGAFIAMHGTAPRSGREYISSRLAADGKTRAHLASEPDLFSTYYDAYPGFITTTVIPETQYFARIFADEAYATRFKEVMRTIALRPGYRCAITGPALLIVGPRWMQAFNLAPDNFWWIDDRRAFIERLPAEVRSGFALIIDTDEDPSWLPGRGFVTPDDCRALPISAPGS